MFGGLKKWVHEWRVRRHARWMQRYAAAQVNHLVGEWMPPVKNVNDLITWAAPIVRPRMRQLVRDFPPFAAAVNRLVQFTVGTGIQFQSRIMDADGDPDMRARTAVEDVVKRFMDECDVGGSPAYSQHYYDLKELSVRQELESGEFLAVRTRHHDQRNKFLPWGIQLIESDRLTNLGARVQGDNLLASGVEYNRKTGAMVAFHAEDEGYGKATRIPAEHVVFGFHRQRPGQVRGMTKFASAIMLAHDIGDAVQSEVDAFKMASKWLGVVKTPDIELFQKMRNILDASGSPANKSFKLTPIEDLENATLEYLRPGEDIEFKSNPRGDQAFRHFTTFMLRLAAIGADLPYELISGDYSGMNYTTLRGVRQDFKLGLAPTQDRSIRQFDAPIIYSVLDEAVLRGRIHLPGYWSDPWHYRKAVWVKPGMWLVDPLKDNKAAVVAVQAGFKSPQEVILERGGEPEQILDEITAWKKMCEERGLDFNLEDISTGNANNPAVVSGEDGEGA